MIKAAGLEAFKQWRLALVVLLVSYIPLAVFWVGYEALISFASYTIYGAEDGFAVGGMDPVLAQMILSWAESPFSFLLVFGLLSYPFLVWGMVVWWRSQGGRITVRAPLKSLWCVGLIYLVPMLISAISALPYFLTDFGAEEFLDDPIPAAPSPLLPNVVTFVSYWLVFRLAKALIDAAQGQGASLKEGWQSTAPDNKLCLYIALDLTVLTFLLDAVSRVFQSISDARWERALENEQFDIPALTLLDTAQIGIETLVLTWLIFVELALVWSLARRHLDGSSGERGQA